MGDLWSEGTHWARTLLPAPTKQDECDVCSTSLFENGKKCKQCKFVIYCGRECQRIDWRASHREECKTLATRTWDDAACYSHCWCKSPHPSLDVSSVTPITVRRRACRAFCTAETIPYHSRLHPAFLIVGRKDRRQAIVQSMDILASRGFDWDRIRTNLPEDVTLPYRNSLCRFHRERVTIFQRLLDGLYDMQDVHNMLPRVITSTLFPTDEPVSNFAYTYSRASSVEQIICLYQGRVIQILAGQTRLPVALLNNIVAPYLWFSSHLFYRPPRPPLDVAHEIASESETLLAVKSLFPLDVW